MATQPILTIFGFGISGYRSFKGNELSLLGPCNRTHLITGQNNSGKSALLEAFEKTLDLISLINCESTQKEYPFHSPIDAPRHSDRIDTKHSVCLSCNEILNLANSVISSRSANHNKESNIIGSLDSLLRNQAFSRGNIGYCWFDFTVPNPWSRPTTIEPSIDQYEAAGSPELQQFASLISEGIQDNLDAYTEIVRWLLHSIRHHGHITIPAKRAPNPIQENSRPSKDEVARGVGLPEKLLEINNPEDHDRLRAEKQKRLIETFMKEALNASRFDFSVGIESHEISVNVDESGFMPLSTQGTGLSDLLIIATTIASFDNTYILIEEPELHLHPTLQRQMMRALDNDASGNRFIVTTHSPALVNSPNSSITNVIKREDTSQSTTIDNIIDVRNALNDIGARPSDLLLSNFVIWVEGPSDRIYVNDWIHRMDSSLTEGIEYSVMHYGGSLLKHLTARPDNDDNQQYSMFHINTSLCVLMDSDKENESSTINQTKQRIEQECSQIDAMSWITWGYTIENYYTGEQLEKAIRELYPDKQYDGVLCKRYTAPLKENFANSSFGPDKVEVAKRLTGIANALENDKTDLKKKMQELIERIQIASGRKRPND